MTVVKYTRYNKCIGFIYDTDNSPNRFWEFHVQGLESLAKEGENPIADGIENSCLIVYDAPEGTLFTIAESDGQVGRNYLEIHSFQICETTSKEDNQEKAKYGHGLIEGNYRVIARADTPVKVCCLINWWEQNNIPKTLQYAENCARWLKKSDLKCPTPISDLLEGSRTIWIEPALNNHLRQVAKDCNISISEIIEEALKHYLQQFDVTYADRKE